MVTFINMCCCYWERDTGNGWETSCLFTTTYLVSSPWRPAQVYVEQEQLFFTDVKHGYSHLEEKSVLWNENKWGVKFYSRAKENPSLENFCHIWGPPKPPTIQEILCFLAYCYHYSRKAKNRALLCTLQNILHLTWTLSAQGVTDFKQLYHFSLIIPHCNLLRSNPLGIGLRSWVFVKMVLCWKLKS